MPRSRRQCGCCWDRCDILPQRWSAAASPGRRIADLQCCRGLEPPRTSPLSAQGHAGLENLRQPLSLCRKSGGGAFWLRADGVFSPSRDGGSPAGGRRCTPPADPVGRAEPCGVAAVLSGRNPAPPTLNPFRRLCEFIFSGGLSLDGPPSNYALSAYFGIVSKYW